MSEHPATADDLEDDLDNEAVETTKPAPATEPDPILDDARKALASGHMPADMVQRQYGLSDAELAAISKPAPSRQSVTQQLREIDELRKSDPKKYWSDEVQAKSLSLIETQLKQQAEREAIPAETGDRLAKIDAELRNIDDRRRENSAAYRKDEALQQRELQLLTEKEQLTNGTAGLPEDVLEEWAATGGVAHHVEVARNTAQQVFDELHEDEQAEFVENFEAMPPELKSDVYKFISIDASDNWRPASEQHVKSVAAIDPELIDAWGKDAPRRLGQLRGRLGMMLKGASPAKRAAAEAFVDGMSPAQFRAVAKAMVGR